MFTEGHTQPRQRARGGGRAGVLPGRALEFGGGGRRGDRTLADGWPHTAAEVGDDGRHRGGVRGGMGPVRRAAGTGWTAPTRQRLRTASWRTDLGAPHRWRSTVTSHQPNRKPATTMPSGSPGTALVGGSRRSRPLRRRLRRVPRPREHPPSHDRHRRPGTAATARQCAVVPRCPAAGLRSRPLPRAAEILARRGGSGGGACHRAGRGDSGRPPLVAMPILAVLGVYGRRECRRRVSGGDLADRGAR